MITILLQRATKSWTVVNTWTHVIGYRVFPHWTRISWEWEHTGSKVYREFKPWGISSAVHQPSVTSARMYTHTKTLNTYSKQCSLASYESKIQLLVRHYIMRIFHFFTPIIFVTNPPLLPRLILSNIKERDEGLGETAETNMNLHL